MKALPPIALLLTTCATAPQREADRQCGMLGRHYVAEAYAVGGIPVNTPPPGPDRSGTGGPRDLGPLTTLRAVYGGVGELKLLPGRPPAAPPEGLVLRDVELGHDEIGQGGTIDGVANYTRHRDAQVTLEARATVVGYGWKMDVKGGRAGFWLGCLAGPRQVVDWTFQLHDADGHDSNTITRSITCTGQPLPGAAPRLESVELEQSDLVAGWRTMGSARFSGTHPPLQLIARSYDRSYGWRGPPYLQERPDPERFTIACRENRGIHSVEWWFSVRDSYGRESNVIRRGMNCGVCQ